MNGYTQVNLLNQPKIWLLILSKDITEKYHICGMKGLSSQGAFQLIEQFRGLIRAKKLRNLDENAAQFILARER